jgi:dTDP-4-dehydrorhamnose reductase
LPADDVLALGHDELDVADPGAIDSALDSARPDVVIHAAAWTDTAGCERDPERATIVNATGAGNVARACARLGAEMVYISSNEVFDGDASGPYPEDAEPRPINAYARSKLEGERAVTSALERHSIVRTSWLYGPGRVSFPEKVIQGAREHGKLRMVTDEAACPTFTVDLADAIVKLIRARPSGIYHLTNAEHCSRLEWAREILGLAGMRDIEIEPVTQADFAAPFRKPVFSALANTRAAALGITLRPWRLALAEHLSKVGASSNR